MVGGTVMWAEAMRPCAAVPLPLPAKAAAMTISSPACDPWQWEEATWLGIVVHVRAGRSLKPGRWKGGARFAVALSFDADHETLELRFGGKSFGKLSQGQYGGRVGTPRILRLLEKHGVPATFFMPAVSALLHPDEPRAIASDGHELGIHSWIHEFNSTLPYEAERNLAFRAREVLARLSGAEPVGMRTASWDFSPSTLEIIREMGLVYDSSLMADTEPYELLENGEPTGIVEIPVEWIRDDAVYFNMDRMSALRPYTSPDAVFEIFRRELEGAHQDGGLFVLTMHPHVIGHRSRIWILEEIIRLARALDGVWFATHAEVARYCAANAGLQA